MRKDLETHSFSPGSKPEPKIKQKVIIAWLVAACCLALMSTIATYDNSRVAQNGKNQLKMQQMLHGQQGRKGGN